MALVLNNCALTEYCFMNHPLNDFLSVIPVRPKNGYIEAPDLPGLGVKFDESLLKKYPYSPSENKMISTDEKDIQLDYY